MRKIGTRLALGIGVLLGLCLVIGIVSYTETRVVRANVEEMTVCLQSLSDRIGVLSREGFQDLRAVEKVSLTML